jgi:four helix bundle protein
MFDFEKLTVYQKAKLFYKNTNNLLLQEKTIGSVITNQLKRAALSVPLNIAEGTSRYSKADRRNFYVISRGSVFECVAIFDILKEEGLLPVEQFQRLYKESEELSKMLFAMIQQLDGKGK